MVPSRPIVFIRAAYCPIRPRKVLLCELYAQDANTWHIPEHSETAACARQRSCVGQRSTASALTLIFSFAYSRGFHGDYKQPSSFQAFSVDCQPGIGELPERPTILALKEYLFCDALPRERSSCRVYLKNRIELRRSLEGISAGLHVA